MAKRTAIIDIGSNSARLVIYERTSRFGFHLICEQKSKVRIGEGAYAKDGYLQPIGINRAYLALKSFAQTTKKYRANKILCVATSALRDAPNGREFVRWIEANLKLSIKIIDGDEEARLGAIAANNLLPIQNGITIDIGGGSSDLSLIRENKIIETCSLNIGTVRLKELFMDQGISIAEAQAYVHKELEKLPDSFAHATAIGIGGTARSLSKGIMKSSHYPLNKLHAFKYTIADEAEYFHSIIHSSRKDLSRFHLKEGRFDTIREGTLIFVEILKRIDAKEVITSSVGVREGLFLRDLLRHSRLRFPKTLNPSMRSILDRFDNLTEKNSKVCHRLSIASDLYEVCHNQFHLDKSYQKTLHCALKLSNIGKTLNIYQSRQHAFYIAMQELNFGYTHQEMILVSSLLRTEGSILLKKSLYAEYKELLPPKQTMKFLSFIYNITIALHENSNDAEIHFSFSDNILTITSTQSLYHAKESIALLGRPREFTIAINDMDRIPHYKF